MTPTQHIEANAVACMVVGFAALLFSILALAYTVAVGCMRLTGYIRRQPIDVKFAGVLFGSAIGIVVAVAVRWMR